MHGVPRKIPNVHLAKEGHKPTIVSFSVLKRMINDGIVQSHDLVYYKGLGNWTKICNAKGFRSLFSKINSAIGTRKLDEIAFNVFSEQDNTSRNDAYSLNFGKNPETENKVGNAKAIAQAAVCKPCDKQIKPNGSANFAEIFSNKKIISVVFMAVSAAIVVVVGGFFMSGIPRITTLSGRITANENPLKHGIIVFEKKSNSQLFYGSPIENGKYEIKMDGMVSCNYIVRIWEIKNIGRSAFMEAWVFHSPVILKLAADCSTGSVPADYNRLSVKSVPIKSGVANVFDFDVPSVSPKK